MKIKGYMSSDHHSRSTLATLPTVATLSHYGSMERNGAHAVSSLGQPVIHVD